MRFRHLLLAFVLIITPPALAATQAEFHAIGQVESGHDDNAVGDLTNVRGKLTDVCGDLSGVSGDLTDVGGDLSRVWGDLTYVGGDLTGVLGELTGVRGYLDDCEITQEDRRAGIHISELIAADAAVVSKEDADAIERLKSEIKAYDLRMDNDAKRIAELEAELDWWVELAHRGIKEDCSNLPAYIKKMRADLANANATIGKLREAVECIAESHDAESVRHLHETDPRPMTPAGLVHVSGTVTLNQWVAIRRVQQATLTREQEQDDVE